jgi:hypothetical protein
MGLIAETSLVGSWPRRFASAHCPESRDSRPLAIPSPNEHSSRLGLPHSVDGQKLVSHTRSIYLTSSHSLQGFHLWLGGFVLWWLPLRKSGRRVAHHPIISLGSFLTLLDWSNSIYSCCLRTNVRVDSIDSERDMKHIYKSQKYNGCTQDSAKLGS